MLSIKFEIDAYLGGKLCGQEVDNSSHFPSAT